MRRFLVPIFAVALAACGGKSDIKGSLTVHTGITGTSDQVRVLLGDGSKFDQPVDDKGDVTFTDPSLSGRVDVTVVDRNGQNIQVTTVADYGHPELWTYIRVQPLVATFTQTSVSGQVTGLDGGQTVSIQAVGPGVSGSTFTDSSGNFTLDVWGSGPAALFAEQRGSGSTPVEVGLLPGLVIDGGTLSGQSLALDHPVNQSFTLSFAGLDGYDPNAGKSIQATLAYTYDGAPLFSTSASGAPPLSIPAIAPTAPFDRADIHVQSEIGQPEDMPFGRIGITQSVAASNAATVNLLRPPVLVEPLITPKNVNPYEIPVSDLRLRWKADGRAQAAVIQLVEANSDGFSMSWIVYAPADVGGFDFFALPQDASPIPRFTPGLLAVSIGSSYVTGLEDYSDIFVRTLEDLDAAGVQDNEVSGFLKLK